MRVSESQIGLFDAIYTQRAIRSYKPEPVPQEMMVKVIEAATKAPSGGNSQPWAFIVVQDREKRNKLAEYAKEGFAGMYENALARMKPGDPPPFENLKPMIETFEVIPCVIIACLVRPPGQALGTGNYSSIF